MVDAALLAYNFTLGLSAFFSPCGIPMLPAYLSYYLTREGEASGAGKAALARGLLGGLIAAAGAFVVLAGIGALAQWIGAPFKARVAWLELAGGLLLIGMGALVLAGRGPSVAFALRPGTRRGALGLLSFGALYAAVAAGCVAPLYVGMLVVAQSAPTAGEGLLRVGAYAAGFAVLLVAATALVSTARHETIRALKALVPKVERAGGAVLVLAGLYLVWYWSTVVR
jgi:cytochrome c-type biogenesis protein